MLDVVRSAQWNGEPVNGYQVIQQIAERSNGAWRPSPGSVYPTIQQLEDEGLVHRSADGRKTTYELTPAGRAEIEARRADVAALEHGIAETVRQRAERLTELLGAGWDVPPRSLDVHAALRLQVLRQAAAGQ